MIRVMYHWRVSEENREKFRAAWEKTTLRIRDTVEGARGSMFLESADDPGVVITMALWEGPEQWTSFMATTSDSHMVAMHSFAEKTATEVYNLIEDHSA